MQSWSNSPKSTQSGLRAWGGWEIATHIHNERLCLKHEADSRGLLLSLYSQVWVAFDGPPEE